MLEKIKSHSNVLFFIASVVLTGSLGFGLGRLSRVEEGRVPVKIEGVQETASAVQAVKPIVVNEAKGGGGQYVASKSGTKYYLPSCSGVNRIKPENRVYFATKEAAERAGLGPASNCPGL